MISLDLLKKCWGKYVEPIRKKIGRVLDLPLERIKDHPATVWYQFEERKIVSSSSKNGVDPDDPKSNPWKPKFMFTFKEFFLNDNTYKRIFLERVLPTPGKEIKLVSGPNNILGRMLDQNYNLIAGPGALQNFDFSGNLMSNPLTVPQI